MNVTYKPKYMHIKELSCEFPFSKWLELDELMSRFFRTIYYFQWNY